MRFFCLKLAAVTSGVGRDQQEGKDHSQDKGSYDYPFVHRTVFSTLRRN